jgi:hypothetical protein
VAAGRSFDSRSEAAILGMAGIRVIGDKDVRGVRAACMRVARRLRASEQRVFGLVPVDDRVGVPPVAVQLGAALMDLSGATVAYVDANVHWPALAIDGTRAEDEHSLFATRWLFQSLALVTPRFASSAGDNVPRLRWLLSDGGELFQYWLLDLTGFQPLGELPEALDLVDRVIAVANAGDCREADVLRLLADIPGDRLLGTLLVGGR